MSSSTKYWDCTWIRVQETKRPVRLHNATWRQLKNILTATFVNSRGIWGLKGETHLLIFLLTGISFDPSTGLGHVHFTCSEPSILLWFSGVHLTSAAGLHWLLRHLVWDTYGNHPGLVRSWQCEGENMWGQSLTSQGWELADACPTCVPWVDSSERHLSWHSVPEGTGPSFPQLWPNSITHFVWTGFPSCLVFPFPHPPLQFPELTSQRTCIQSLVPVPLSGRNPGLNNLLER